MSLEIVFFAEPFKTEQTLKTSYFVMDTVEMRIHRLLFEKTPITFRARELSQFISLQRFILFNIRQRNFYPLFTGSL